MKKFLNLKSIIFLIITFFVIGDITSQNMESGNSGNNSGKGSSSMVDKVTGDFNFSIPIVSISDIGVTIPVSLSYNGSGIKVEQPATSVGLGWNLNSSGYIQRELRGFPDDIKKSQTSTTTGQIGWLYDNGTDPISKVIADLDDSYSTTTQEQTLSEVLVGLLNSDPEQTTPGDSYDLEPDIFSYNILGRTGKFIFGIKNSIASVQHIVQIPYTPIKIEYSISSNNEGIEWFKIIDELGVTYLFEEKSIIETNSASEIEDNIRLNNHLYNSKTSVQKYTDSWLLTKVTSPMDEYVEFTYTTFKEYLDHTFYKEFSQYESTSFDGTDPKNLIWINSNTNTLEQPYIERKEIKEIIGPLTKVVFNYLQKREDVPFLTTATHPKALNEIVVYQNLNDTYNKQLRRFILNYSYFEVPENYYNTYSYNLFNDAISGRKRLKLDGITEYNGDMALPSYRFDYDYDLSNNRFLPSRYSYSKDIWGYNNSKNSNTHTTPSLYVFPSQSGFKKFSIIGNPGNYAAFYWNGAYMFPDSDSKKFGLLNKVNLPDGGYIKVIYESDDYRLDYIDANINGGGTRVSQIKTYDGESLELVTKSYEYKSFSNNANSSGKAISLPCFGFFDPHVSASNIDWNDPHYVRTNIDINSVDNEIILYENVKEILQGRGSNKYTFDISGSYGETSDSDGPFEVPQVSYLRYSDDITNNIASFTSLLSSNFVYPYANNLNYSWNRGALKKVESFDIYNNIVKSTEIDYLIFYPNGNSTYDEVYGVKTGFLDNNAEQLSDPVIAYSKYKIASNLNRLVQNIITKYDGQSNAFTTTTYSYNEEGFVSEVETIDAEQNSSSSKLTYVSDLWRSINIINEPTDQRTSALFNMMEQNIVSRLIESVSLKNNKITGASVSTFKTIDNTDNRVVPFEDWVLEINEPTLSYSNTFIDDGSSELLFTMDENYLTKISNYNNFDSHGNLLEANMENQPSIASIYSYNSSLPVADIENATNHDNGIGLSCGYTGFENGDLTNLEDNNFWYVGSYGQIYNQDAHTGNYSVKLENVARASWSCFRTFEPNNQDNVFQFSAWVKSGPSLPDNSGGIGYEIYDQNDQLVSGTWDWVTFKNSETDWKLISIPIDLNQIKIDHSLSGNVKIKCFAVNYDASKYFLIDDVRFVADDAFMTTYTYEPLVGVTSTTGPNNIVAKYTYDDLGRRKNVIDHNNNTLSNVKYNYANNQLEISERNIDFGNEDINPTSPYLKTVVFSNNSNNAINLILNLESSSDESYSLINPPGPNAGGEVTIIANSSYTLNVLFDPQSYGEKIAFLNIVDVNGIYNQKVHINGIGGGAYFSDAPTFEFTDWVALNSSKTKILSFINKYDVPIEVAFSLENANQNYILDLQNTTLTIPKKGQVPIPVTFSPITSTGYSQEVLKAVYTHPNSGLSVNQTVTIDGFAYKNITFSLSGSDNYIDCANYDTYTYTVNNLIGDSNKSFSYTWYVKNKFGQWVQPANNHSSTLSISIIHDLYCFNNAFTFKCEISQTYPTYGDNGKTLTVSNTIYTLPLAGTCNSCN